MIWVVTKIKQNFKFKPDLTPLMKEITYPSPDRIIEYNILILELIRVKKSDQPKVLSYSKIKEVVEECVHSEGDIYDKSLILLKGITQKHPFASGNRRTAFITAKDFIVRNGFKFGIKDDPACARVLLGVRERFYSDKELKEWIQHGKIREFKR